jgi:hypothetical protein
MAVLANILVKPVLVAVHVRLIVLLAALEQPVFSGCLM